MVNENEVITIKLDDIIPNRFQPREVFDEESLNELAESIKLHGVIQPIIVRPVDNKYEIIAGERRYKASVLAGKTDIPAIVKVKDDQESSIIAFIENSQRKNVSAIEEAKTCERLLANNELTQEQLAKQLGMSQSTLANKLRLLSLPIEVQDALLNGDISERHARALLSIKDTKEQIGLLEKIKENKMTVRELEGEIKNMMGNEGMNSQGLYDLPGVQEGVNDNTNSDLDLSKYEINPISEVEPTAVNTISENNETQPSQTQGQFLSFLNDFDDSKVAEPLNLPQPEPEENKEEPTEAPNNFNSFLNDFDSKPIVDSINEQKETQENQNPVVDENKSAFDDFLKKYENTVVATPLETAPTPVLEPQVEEISTQVEETSVPKNDTPSTANSSFDDFLKKYEAPVVTPVEVSTQEEPPKDDKGFNDFLNNTNTDDLANKYLNPINDVVPKVEYVENSPNYVDISKPVSYDSVDSILKELKETIDRVKQSKYKITTEETDYEDVYEIKIVIDRRNFI